MDTDSTEAYYELCRKIHERFKTKSIVVTRGSKSVIVSTLTGQGIAQASLQVPKLDGSLIKDTNGAGDSFVGGFLSQVVVDRPID